MKIHKSFEYTYNDIASLIKVIKPFSDQAFIITLQGPLGVGKTTFLKCLFKIYGIQEPITSPTFSYVHSYQADGILFYHFDLYRLANLREFMIAGFDEYLHQPDAKVFIEWPEIIEPLLPVYKVCKLVFDYSPQAEKRIVEVSCNFEII